MKFCFILIVTFVSHVSLLMARDIPFGVLYVNDGADYMTRGVAADIEGLRRVVDSYRDSGHRILIYGVRSGLLTFNYESNLPGEYFGEGYSTDLLSEHSGLIRMRDMLKSYFDRGIDPFGEIVKRANERGLRILAQIRPNNFNPTKTQIDRVVNGRFYYEHPEYRIEGSSQWDYGKPFVRKYFIDVIREILERYNIDGLDIDFTQQPPFFHDSEPNKREIMNDFMRSVRKELERVGKKRGKKMYFSVGIRLDPPGWHWRKSGLDLPTWAKEGLVDLMAIYHLFQSKPVPGLKDLSEYQSIVKGTKCLFYIAHSQIRRFDRAYQGVPGITEDGHISQDYFSALERMARSAGADGVLYRNYQVYPANDEISDPYHEYRSNNVSYYPEALPENALNRWVSNSEGSAALNAGILLLQGRVYHRNPAMLAVGSEEVTAEALVRVESAENYRDCFLELANGRRHALLELFQNRMRLSDVGFSEYREVSLDLKSFRRLRLSLNRDGLAKVYIDDNEQPSLEKRLKNQNPYWRTAFGSGNRSGRSEWKSVHYTLEGAFSPAMRSFPGEANQQDPR